MTKTVMENKPLYNFSQPERIEFKIILFTIVFSLLSGCTTVVKVSKQPTVNNSNMAYSKLDGIPFYVKKEILNQQTQYSRTWLNAKLAVEKKLVDTSSGQRVETTISKELFSRNVHKKKLSALNKLKAKIVSGFLDSNAEVAKMVSEFNAIQVITDFETITPQLIGNTSEPEWIVDGSNIYYLNAPLPWFGSGNLTHELRDDGTLSKVVSNPDTKLSEGISNLIPLKEFLEAKHVDPLSEVSDEEVMSILSQSADLPILPKINQIAELKTNLEKHNVISVEINEVGYLYSFKKVHPVGSETIPPISFDLNNQNFSRQALSASNSTNPAPRKDNTVDITGSVVLPENWKQ